MSAELLLELPSKVVKVFALPQAPGTAFQKSAVVIVQSDCVSIAHGENGSLYNHYNFGRKTNYGAIVDCVYLFHQRQFLVAFQDSSLVVVPLDCKDVAVCERTVWPKQPLKLQSTDGKSTALFCDGGYVCVVTISDEGSLPTPPSTWNDRSLTQVSKDSVFVQSNGRFVSAVSLRSAPAASSSVTPSKKKSKAAQADTDSENVVYNLSVWSVPTLLSGASVLLTSQSATTAALSLGSGESVVSVVGHAKADSLSVITTQEGKSTGRWLKVALDGSVLFERALSGVTSNAGDYTEVGDQLVTVSADRVLKYFDVRYGTEVRAVALNDSTSNSPVSASWVLIFESDANKSSSAAGPSSVHVFISKMLKASGPFNLYRRTLGAQTAGALSSSLCQSIGKLASAKEIGAATQLPTAQKRQLQDLSVQYQTLVQSEAAQDLKDLIDPAERQERKHRRLAVEVPQEAAKTFLTNFEAREKGAVEVESWEWDLVKVLARSGDLSISRNPSLVTAAAVAKRLDVLAVVVEYVPDLSEKLCVRIMAHLMLMPEDDLANLTVVGGIIQYNEEEGSDKKKAKKSSKAVGTEEDRRLGLLRALVEGTLRRASAFSAILLGEAVRLLPLPCAVLLLQVVTHFLRGLCSTTAIAAEDEGSSSVSVQVPVLAVSKVHLHAYVTDEEIKRAATWAEALLDGHFSALALHAVGHAATRRALTYAMGTISGAEEGSELVQSTLGLWTHITRVIHNGGQQVKPITSLYQVEQLDLR